MKKSAAFKKFKLGKDTKYREQITKNLLGLLIQREAITTTLGRAQKLKPRVESVISLARREAIGAKAKSKCLMFESHQIDAIQKLNDVLIPRYKDGSSICRITEIAARDKDNARMAVIELIGSPFDTKKFMKDELLTEKTDPISELKTFCKRNRDVIPGTTRAVLLLALRRKHFASADEMLQWTLNEWDKNRTTFDNVYSLRNNIFDQYCDKNKLPYRSSTVIWAGRGANAEPIGQVKKKHGKDIDRKPFCNVLPQYGTFNESDGKHCHYPKILNHTEYCFLGQATLLANSSQLCISEVIKFLPNHMKETVIKQVEEDNSFWDSRDTAHNKKSRSYSRSLLKVISESKALVEVSHIKTKASGLAVTNTLPQKTKFVLERFDRPLQPISIPRYLDHINDRYKKLFFKQIPSLLHERRISKKGQKNDVLDDAIATAKSAITPMKYS